MTYSMAAPYLPVEPAQIEFAYMRVLLALAAALSVAGVAPASETRPRDKEQDAAWRATRQGQILPLRMIMSMVEDEVRGARYLGPEFDGERYRLKYKRGIQVMWIDVDARTGRVLGRSGF